MTARSPGDRGALVADPARSPSRARLTNLRDASGARSAMAQGVVDHTGDLADAVRAQAPEGLTGVVHLAGDAAHLAALLRPGGRLVSSLGAGAEQVGRDDITATPVMAAVSAPTLAQLLAQVADGSLVATVGRAYELDDAPSAVKDSARTSWASSSCASPETRVPRDPAG